LFAVNLVLATHDRLWALRYPETHRLFVLERAAGGHHGYRHLATSSAAGTMRLRSQDLAEQPAVVIASEPLDENPGWRPLEPGELLHVGPDLKVSSTIAIDRPPAKLLTLADLDPRAARSQQAAASPADGRSDQKVT
jgi:glutamine amidotransferase